MNARGLERYYPGDDAWQTFARVFLEGEADEETQRRVEEIVGDKELAAVIAGLVLRDPIGWLDKEIPALGGRSPRECLENPGGKKRLKTMLMRMP